MPIIPEESKEELQTTVLGKGVCTGGEQRTQYEGGGKWDCHIIKEGPRWCNRGGLAGTTTAQGPGKIAKTGKNIQ